MTELKRVTDADDRDSNFARLDRQIRILTTASIIIAGASFVTILLATAYRISVILSH